jgi:hypothetical protein
MKAKDLPMGNLREAWSEGRSFAFMLSLAGGFLRLKFLDTRGATQTASR